MAIGQAFLFTVLPNGLSFRPLGEVFPEDSGVPKSARKPEKTIPGFSSFSHH